MDIATFGAGCFWCIEAILLNVPGITSIDVGYTGGHIDNPTYKMVCEGSTGHAEVAQIKFDTKKITYEELLLIFFKINIKNDYVYYSPIICPITWTSSTAKKHCPIFLT